MKTPLFILAQQISNDATKEVVSCWKKGKWKSVPGTIGLGKVRPEIKKSRDLCLSPEEVDKLLPKYIKDLKHVTTSYLKRYPQIDNIDWALREPCNIQHYKPGEGFGGTHFERTFHKVRRLLVWMTYLTDNPKGGTYFKSQDFYCPAEKGLTLIWPAEFTFEHNGVIDLNKPKLIITGWFSYYEDPNNPF